MQATFNLQISTERQRIIDVLNAAGERVYFFSDTSRSAAILRKWMIIVFYSEEQKVFVCLLYCEIYEQILFTDI